jgi:glycosyltransferase involved in cell wall biosynthesis
MPAVSVIVPNYNHARFLRRRIDTILAQTFQDFELILLDDCSTDDSRSMLSEYGFDPRVRLEFNEVNSGSTFKQWNKGVRMARGEYVWIAESDDYADVRLLERLVTVLGNEPDVAFAYGRSWRVTEDDRVDGFGDWYLELVDPERWKTDFCVDGRGQFLSYFAHCCVVPNASAAVFRKRIYERVGCADESLRVCGDWKVWAAMALVGKVAFVSEPLNYYRLHQASVLQKSRRGAVDVIESLQVVRWILDQTALPQLVLDKVYEMRADSWVPALMSMDFPLRLKLKILQNVRAVDPHPVRRVLHPALLTVQRKFLRHWRSIRPAMTETVGAGSGSHSDKDLMNH